MQTQENPSFNIEDLPEDPWEILNGVELPEVNTNAIIASTETEDDNENLPRFKDITGLTLPKNIRCETPVKNLFDDETEQQLVALLKYRISQACNMATPWEKRKKAIKWIFCSTDDSMEENSFLSLRDVLDVFGARHYIIQTRVVFELYKKSIPLQAPLPFLADPIPDVIESEIYFSVGFKNAENAIAIAKTAWMWPGMRLDFLLAESTKYWKPNGEEFPDVLESLVQKGYIGIAGGFAYAICRNPLLYKNQTYVSWSSRF